MLTIEPVIFTKKYGGTMQKRIHEVLAVFITFFLLPSAAWCMSSSVPGPNLPPRADAGEDQVVELHQTVFLDANKSRDPDGDDLSYHWRIIAKPPGAREGLHNAWRKDTCHFAPDKPGNWVIRLYVYDGRYDSRDIISVIVNKPKTSAPPDVPDLMAADMKAYGMYAGKYIRDISVRITNQGSAYLGPVAFRLVAIDKLSGGVISWDKKIHLDAICLAHSESKWFTLIPSDMEWPEDVKTVTFSVFIDPERKLEETSSQNNQVTKTLFRAQLRPRLKPAGLIDQTDFAIKAIDLEGIHKNKYLSEFVVHVRNRGKRYYGPLDVKVYSSANFAFEKELTLDPACFERNEQKQINLIEPDELLWPEDMPVLSFVAQIDEGHKIDDADRTNNAKPVLNAYRGDLGPRCGVELTGPVRIDGKLIRDAYRYYTFPIKQYGNWMSFTLRNPCSATKTTNLLLIFDANNIFTEGQNHVVAQSRLTLGPGRSRYIRLDKLAIPRQATYRDAYTHFAVLEHYKDGYDVLYSMEAKAEFIKIIGK